MKKWIAAMLTLSLLLSLCACTQTPEGTEPSQTEPSGTEQTAEATEGIQAEVFYPYWPEETEEAVEKQDFSHVDESKPNASGIYELHSPEGLQQLAAHPDGKFKLLCDIDLGGAAWTPVTEFTGEIEGQKYTISNFIVQSGETTGFVGVNKGAIKNLYLSNMTISTDKGLAGGIAAVNEGTISGCIAGGTMELTGTAIAGGLVGQMTAGSLLYSDCDMVIHAAGEAQVGLLAGDVKNVTLDNCRYIGTESTKDGQSFVNFAAAEQNVTYTECLWRDNSNSDATLTAESLALREIARAETYKMGTVKWTVSEIVNYMHPTASNMSAVFIPGTVYTGIPYTANFGDLSRFMYCFAEDGSLKEFATEVTIGFDGMDKYMGCDCSGGVYWGWAKVSPTTQWWVTNQMFPAVQLGTVPVGEYEGATTMQDTMEITKANDPQTLAEAYAKLHMSDAIMTFYNNPDDASDHFNHTRLVVEHPVVMRKADGTIDMNASYVITHEQGAKGFNSSWRMYGKFTFQELLNGHYIPLTCQEFIDGKAPELEVTIDTAGEGKAYMATGVVTSNYRLVSTSISITDDAGGEVYEKTVFVNIRRYADVGTIEPSRAHITQQDIAAHAAFLGEMELETGKTYTYTLTAHTAAGDVVVKTFSFVQ